jgi:hypothetical protein
LESEEAEDKARLYMQLRHPKETSPAEDYIFKGIIRAEEGDLTFLLGGRGDD